MAREIPELLFHSTLEVVDEHRPGGFNGSHQLFVLGTYGGFEAARRFSSGAFEALGHKPDDFTTYQVRDPGRDWPHGDGILVFAQSPSGQQFRLGIYATFNEENLAVTPDGMLLLPTGADHLHYVLQTTVDYNKDRSGDAQSTDIVGVFLLRKAAFNAALTCLQEDRDRFVQYEENRDGAQKTSEVGQSSVSKSCLFLPSNAENCSGRMARMSLSTPLQKTARVSMYR
jgi:hypothetical protein